MTELLADVRDGVAVVTLNRPDALNALTLSMIRELTQCLDTWATDDAVYCVIVQGAGGRAFCAGGDIRALYDAKQAGGRLTADFFRQEYRLNRKIFRYPKPYIALINGIAMGGGVGVSVLGRHRVVCEKTMFAMPETGIGLFPDVGGSYFLPRCPGKLGLYLALTGERLRGVDCVYAGIGDYFISSERHDELITALRSDHDVPVVLSRFNEPADDAPIAGLQKQIDTYFSGSSVEEIENRLAAQDGEWCRKILTSMRSKSPTSQRIAFHQLRQGASLDLEDCLKMEFRLSQHVMAAHDFFEGVRALIIDKDNAPRWRPNALALVSDNVVEEYFAPLGAEDLKF